MKDCKESILYGIMGAGGGVSGMAAIGRCAGGNCANCWWCAGVGIAVLLAAVTATLQAKGKNGNGND